MQSNNNATQRRTHGMTTLTELVRYTNDLLNIAAFQDYCITFYKTRAEHYVPRYCVEVVSAAPPRIVAP